MKTTRLSSIVFLTLLVLGTTGGPSWAENDESTSTAISIGTSQVTVRHQFSPENGAFIGGSYSQSRQVFSGSNDLVGQGIDIMLGYRRYVTLSDVNTFVDLPLTYLIIRDGFSNDRRAAYTAGIFYGIEKLLTPRLSVEGSAGAIMSWYRGSARGKSIFFPRTNLAINYYF